MRLSDGLDGLRDYQFVVESTEAEDVVTVTRGRTRFLTTELEFRLYGALLQAQGNASAEHYSALAEQVRRLLHHFGSQGEYGISRKDGGGMGFGDMLQLGGILAELERLTALPAPEIAPSQD